MIVKDKYASFLNHQWLLEHVKLISVLKPTDKTDPDYEQKIRFWQGALAIPKDMKESIAIQNSIKSLEILKKWKENGNNP